MCIGSDICIKRVLILYQNDILFSFDEEQSASKKNKYYFNLNDNTY